MGSTQQPLTIGAMSPEHFQGYIAGIIKHTVREVTNARFDAIEASIARLELRVGKLEADVSQLKSDVSQLKSDVSQLKVDVSQLKDDVREIKDTQSLYQSRFGIIERFVIRHDSQLQEQLA